MHKHSILSLDKVPSPPLISHTQRSRLACRLSVRDRVSKSRIPANLKVFLSSQPRHKSVWFATNEDECSSIIEPVGDKSMGRRVKTLACPAIGRGGGRRDGPYYTRAKIELHREIITASQRIDNWRNSGRRSFERRQWKSYHKPGGGIKVN